MTENLDSNEDSGRQGMIERATRFLSDPRIKPMPSPIEGIRNGTLISAEKDMPEIGMKQGDTIPIVFDGECIRGGSLEGPTWGVEQLMAEYTENKWWTIVGQLDEWTIVPDSNSK